MKNAIIEMQLNNTCIFQEEALVDCNGIEVSGLSQGIANSQCLRKIVFKSCLLLDGHLQTIARVLAICQHKVALEIIDNPTCSGLLKEFPNNLQELRLESVQMSAPDLEELLKALSFNTSIKKLCLNEIMWQENVEGRCLIDLLRPFSTFEQVELRKNQLNRLEIPHLLKALRSQPHLKRLDLRGNFFGEDGTKGLLEWVCTSSLVCLKISGPFKSRGIAVNALIKILRENVNLEEVFIDSYDLSLDTYIKSEVGNELYTKIKHEPIT